MPVEKFLILMVINQFAELNYLVRWRGRTVAKPSEKPGLLVQGAEHGSSSLRFFSNGGYTRAFSVAMAVIN